MAELRADNGATGVMVTYRDPFTCISRIGMLGGNWMGGSRWPQYQRADSRGSGEVYITGCLKSWTVSPVASVRL